MCFLGKFSNWIFKRNTTKFLVFWEISIHCIRPIYLRCPVQKITGKMYIYKTYDVHFNFFHLTFWGKKKNKNTRRNQYY